MEEKRRSQRIPMHITLHISDIYMQPDIGIHDLESPIEVINLSAHGMGFITECILPLDYYFDTDLYFDKDFPTIHAVVKLVRVTVLETDCYQYGCEFIDLKDSDQQILDAFSKNQSIPLSIGQP